MPRNGTGTYTLPYNWNDDLANGITIQAGRMMGQQDDIATGLTNSIAKDGQTPYTGNQSMGNNKITNLGNSTDARDAIPTAQVQNSSLFYLGTSLGVADAYTAAAVPAITAYETTMSFRLKIHATNATTTPTLQLNGIGNPALDAVIKKIDSNGAEVALAAGDLDAGAYYDFQRNTANNAWILMNENKADVPQATTAIFGKTLLPLPIKLSNNAVAPNNNMDFGTGVFQFDDGSGMSTFSALTKELDSTWNAGTNQGGLDTGVKAADTWYYMYAIQNPTTGVSDALFTATYGAPTMPAGFTKKAYIGALLTDVSSNILSGNFHFRRDGSYRFLFSEQITDYNSPVPSTSTAIAITAPKYAEAILNITYLDNDQLSSAIMLIEEGQTDVVPTNRLATVVSNSDYYGKNANFHINVGVNQRIFARSSDAGATVFSILSTGFIDNNF